jgi:hypothetical protein
MLRVDIALKESSFWIKDMHYFFNRLLGPTLAAGELLYFGVISNAGMGGCKWLDAAKMTLLHACGHWFCPGVVERARSLRKVSVLQAGTDCYQRLYTFFCSVKLGPIFHHSDLQIVVSEFSTSFLPFSGHFGQIRLGMVEKGVSW